MNVPQIIIPGDMKQVRAMNLHSGGAALPPQTPNRRIVGPPDKSRESPYQKHNQQPKKPLRISEID